MGKLNFARDVASLVKMLSAIPSKKVSTIRLDFEDMRGNYIDQDYHENTMANWKPLDELLSGQSSRLRFGSVLFRVTRKSEFTDFETIQSWFPLCYVAGILREWR